MWNEYLLMGHMIQMTIQIKLLRASSLISDNLTENEREVEKIQQNTSERPILSECLFHT